MRDKKIFFSVIGIVFLLLTLLYIYRRSRVFVYEEHLDDTVITVDDRSVTLREFGCYIYSLEDFVGKQAVRYDASDPLAYWNKHFRAGLDSAFISLMARDKAYDVCICDMIYEEMAKEAGCRLTDEERTEALETAAAVFQGMTDEQIEALGITQEIVENNQIKKRLIGKFAKAYVKQIDFDGYAGYREELISAGGAYYEEKILPLHRVKVNAYIKNGLKFGRITLNRRESSKDKSDR